MTEIRSLERRKHTSLSRLTGCLFFATIFFLSGAALRAQDIPYDVLNNCQRTLFQSFREGATAPGLQTWSSLEDTRRLEYAGGTQALNTILIPPPPCQGLSQLPHHRSELRA
jgi:hypothetical protein